MILSIKLAIDVGYVWFEFSTFFSKVKAYVVGHVLVNLTTDVPKGILNHGVACYHHHQILNSDNLLLMKGGFLVVVAALVVLTLAGLEGYKV